MIWEVGGQIRWLPASIETAGLHKDSICGSRVLKRTYNL